MGRLEGTRWRLAAVLLDHHHGPKRVDATVHIRMPVIVKPSDYDRWLTRHDLARPPVDLLRPYDAGEMKTFPVDPRVGNVRNNEPGLCEAHECPPNSA